jgi:hypothetical protein
MGALPRSLGLVWLCWLGLAGCQEPTSTAATDSMGVPSSAPSVTAATSSNATDRDRSLWAGGFAEADWRARWHVRPAKAWGWQNATIVVDPAQQFSQILRVRYPSGSASPAVARDTGAPLGGLQFYADLGLPPQESLRLSYNLRFSQDFDFVKGGKLPGLFGGAGASGGNIPDGTNGFSTRFMWRSQGKGEVYAYLPTSQEYGTSIGRGKWRFTPGVWQRLEQQVDLNQVGKKNGRIRVWLDSKLVLDKGNLTFRTTESLKIEGIFFSTFFGGSDRSWATPKDVDIDFANFAVFPAIIQK